MRSGGETTPLPGESGDARPAAGTPAPVQKRRRTCQSVARRVEGRSRTRQATLSGTSSSCITRAPSARPRRLAAARPRFTAFSSSLLARSCGLSMGVVLSSFRHFVWGRKRLVRTPRSGARFRDSVEDLGATAVPRPNRRAATHPFAPGFRRNDGSTAEIPTAAASAEFRSGARHSIGKTDREDQGRNRRARRTIHRPTALRTRAPVEPPPQAPAARSHGAPPGPYCRRRLR